jgi:putative transcriptional regulator
MTTIRHHLASHSLLSFAAGSLPGALAAVAGAHLTMCVACRRELALFEHIGGALLEGLPAMPLEDSEPALPRLPAVARGRPDNPILGHAREEFAGVAWRRIGIGLWHRPLPLPGQGSVQLVKAAPGAVVPDHGHAGAELTLVLRGALIDATGRYGPGDVADLDEEVEHTPAADATAGCICAVANERPTRFHGLLARLLQPWHGL